jgi:hypothetical protein
VGQLAKRPSPPVMPADFNQGIYATEDLSIRQQQAHLVEQA